MKFMKIMILAVALPMVLQAAEQRVEGGCFCICSTEKRKVAKAEKALKRHPAAIPASLRTSSVELAKDVVQGRIYAHKDPTLNSPSAKVELEGRKAMTQAAYGLRAQELAQQAQDQQEVRKKGVEISLSKRMTLGDQLKIVHLKGKVEHDRRSHSARSHRGQRKEQDDAVSVQTQMIDEQDRLSPRSTLKVPRAPVKFTFVDALPTARAGTPLLTASTTLSDAAAITEPTTQLPGVPDEA